MDVIQQGDSQTDFPNITAESFSQDIATMEKEKIALSKLLHAHEDDMEWKDGCLKIEGEYRSQIQSLFLFRTSIFSYMMERYSPRRVHKGYNEQELYISSGFREEIMYFLLEEPVLRTAVLEHVAQMEVIENKQRALVKSLSEGDKRLEMILDIHLEYTKGHLSPVIRKGVKFYHVGHNASHAFELGVDDGQLYSCFYSMDYEDDENPEDCVTAVDAFPSYIGHF